MRCIPISRIFPLPVLLCLLLMASGCAGGYKGSGWSSLLRPEFIRYSTPTDIPPPKVEAVASKPVAGESPAVRAVVKPPPVQTVGAQLLPGAIPSMSSQVLMAVAVKEPAKQAEQISTAGPPRRLAEAPSPDFIYDTQLLVEDVNWRGEVLITGVLTLAPQATLTIEPGTVVRFGVRGAADAAEVMLMIQGRIVAMGTERNPILFTSRFAQPISGDWQGLVLLGSEKRNVLENCRIEGAETGLDASFSTIELTSTSFANCGIGAHLQDALVSVNRGGADGCETGMTLVDSEADLRDPVFSGNDTGIVAERSSLYLERGLFTGNKSAALRTRESRLKISGGRFVGNGAGLTVVSSQGSLSGCMIAENRDCGIFLADSRMRIYGNSIVKNGTDGIRIQNGGGAAWGNTLTGNGGCDISNAGSKDFRAMGNWWGGADATEVSRRVCALESDDRRGRILYLPVMATKPAGLP